MAGLVGAATASPSSSAPDRRRPLFQLAGANEDVSGNCDEAEHANDAGVRRQRRRPPVGTGRRPPAPPSTTAARARPSVPRRPRLRPDEIRSIDAGGAGTVIVAVEGGSLRLVAATPSPGWRVEVEQAAGREVEVDFRSGTKRVQVNVEIEDGQVRERVRVRDDADGTDVRSENGTVVRDELRTTAPTTTAAATARRWRRRQQRPRQRRRRERRPQRLRPRRRRRRVATTTAAPATAATTEPTLRTSQRCDTGGPARSSGVARPRGGSGARPRAAARWRRSATGGRRGPGRRSGWRGC